MKFLSALRSALLGALLLGVTPPAPAWADFSSGAGGGQAPSVYSATGWNLPQGFSLGSGGTNGGIGSVRCFPGWVVRTLTTSALGVRITTQSAGNVQEAIYANSATGFPTGTPLVSTASVSTGTLGAASAAAVVQLKANVTYWFCSNMDNAAAIAAGIGTTSAGLSSFVGVSSLLNAIAQSGGSIPGYSTPATFGTWGDLTSATWTAGSGTTFPVIAFQVGSIP